MFCSCPNFPGPMVAIFNESTSLHSTAASLHFVFVHLLLFQQLLTQPPMTHHYSAAAPRLFVIQSQPLAVCSLHFVATTLLYYNSLQHIPQNTISQATVEKSFCHLKLHFNLCRCLRFSTYGTRFVSYLFVHRDNVVLYKLLHNIRGKTDPPNCYF